MQGCLLTSGSSFLCAVPSVMHLVSLQVSLALPSLQDNLGPGYTYLLFAGVGVVAVAVIYSLVPETKGKTLEEIEASWIDKDS